MASIFAKPVKKEPLKVEEKEAASSPEKRDDDYEEGEEELDDEAEDEQEEEAAVKLWVMRLSLMQSSSQCIHIHKEPKRGSSRRQGVERG